MKLEDFREDLKRIIEGIDDYLKECEIIEHYDDDRDEYPLDITVRLTNGKLFIIDFEDGIKIKDNPFEGIDWTLLI